MKRKRVLITAVAVLLVAAIACAFYLTRQEESKGILFHVTGERGSAYLLGSIHIGTSAMHPLGDVLQDAMEASDIFVFESDTASEASLARLAARQTLPDTASLHDVLGAALYSDVIAAYQALNLSTASLGTKQPWAVINTLAVYSTAAEMGIRNIRKAISLGIEPAVQDYADRHQKQYAYLETVDEVADTMMSFSDALNRYLLQDEIDIVLGRTSPADMDTVAQWPVWWRDGNIEAFRNFYRQSFHSAEEPLYTEYHDKLIAQRNRLMADRLDALLQQGGNYFVTVGLLHLIPEEESMIAILRDMGYAVELVPQP